MESEAVWRVWQCGRAECKVCGGSPAVRDWLWSEVELGFRVLPPWEKWEGQFCAARTFLGFLTRGVVETICQ